MATAFSILSVLTALIPFLIQVWQAKKDKRNALGQAEANELRHSIEHPSTGGDKLFVDKPPTQG